MASLVLGVAGAAVGSFFGPLGTSIGWSLGAAIGGRLFAKGQEGPRLTDLRVQNSAFGQVIPIGFGAIRLSGNVIWSTDLVETKKKSSGKGGPKVTTYSYSASFAVALCEGPIVGVRRIWADGRLIYGEGSAAETLPMTIYFGDETQLADPTMEAEEGAGNVPAHRGTAYVVFTALELGDFGNRIPNLSFEVIASGTIGLSAYSEWPVDYDYPIDASAYSYPFNLNGIEATSGGVILHRYRNGDAYVLPVTESVDNTIYYDRSVYDMHGALITADAQVTTTVDTSTMSVWGSMNSDIAYASWQEAVAPNENTAAWLKAGIITYTPDVDIEGGQQLPIEGSPIYWNGYVYAAGKYLLGDDTYIRRWPAPDGACYTFVADSVSFNADAVRTGYPSSNCVADAGEIVVGDDGYLYWLVGYYAGTDDGTRLFKFDRNLNLLATWWDGAGVNLPTVGYASFVVRQGHFLGQYSAGVYNVSSGHYILYRMGSGTFTWVAEMPILGPLVSPVITLGNGYAAVRAGILQVGSTGITLAEIVGDVSDRSGFASSEYDVTPLTDVVRGYTVGQRMSARAAIEALQPAYQFGAVESNQTAKFVKWGGEVDVTITADELGARPAGDDPVEPLQITHAQEADLPRVINTVYLNVDMDYQEGVQIAQRTITTSDVTASVVLPVVLNDADAKAVTDVLLFNAWLERDRFAFSLPRKWAHLEPTDVVNVDGHVIRLTSKTEVGYTHIDFEGLATRTGVFVSGPVAPTPIGFVPQEPPSANATDLVLLDIPLVTDADYTNGFYAAFAGFQDGGWPGAALFKSVDGGVEYDSIYSTVDASTIGTAITVLGDFTGGNVFDESNTVNVRLTPGSGTLSSSNALGVLNGANRAMIGSEMIAFKTATLTATRTYTLSGLLRGLRGTEWANAGHGTSENFVLLPAQNVEGLGAELGQARLYKAVTSGSALSSAVAVSFTNTGVALKPYAPVELGGGRNGAGDVALTWTRRTRIGGSWIDNNDVPLSEPQEYYVIGIYGSNYATFKRWLVASATQTTTYTAADQTTDFGSPQSTVYFTVLQWGTYGYGYEARGTA